MNLIRSLPNVTLVRTVSVESWKHNWCCQRFKRTENMNCATGQGSRPFGFPVYVKLSFCTHCKRHYEWTSRVYVGMVSRMIWMIRGWMRHSVWQSWSVCHHGRFAQLVLGTITLNVLAANLWMLHSRRMNVWFLNYIAAFILLFKIFLKPN